MSFQVENEVADVLHLLGKKIENIGLIFMIIVLIKKLDLPYTHILEK